MIYRLRNDLPSRSFSLADPVAHAPAQAFTAVNGGDIMGANGTSGNDPMNGNDSANTLYGLDGNDTINGFGGNDSLYGGNGDDVINGGTGTDKMVGGAGNDTYYIDNAGDRVYEYTTPGTDEGGHDLVIASISVTLKDYLEDLTLMGTDGTATGAGNELDNHITGDATLNLLRGNAGDDVMDEGNGGNDKMYGGAGNDTYILHAKARVSEQTVAGTDDGGIDTVIASFTYTLGDFIENLTLADSAASAYGNGLNNVLRGNSYGNRIDGMAGADTMYGGLGNDSYFVDDLGDVVSEQTVPGTDDGGIDRVASTVDFTLGNFIEYLTLGGTAAISGTGNDLGNTLTGNDAYNRITGLGGTDVMTGGGGVDDFVFSKFGTANGIDLIKDFTPGVDHMVFKASDYDWVGGHVLTSAELSLTGVAVGTGAQFVYVPTTGLLYWDSNGTSSGGATRLATLDNKAALQATDFVFESDSPVGTGVAPGTALTYVARFVDKNGNVMLSDGNNGWVALSSFSYSSSSGFVGGDVAGLSFGQDRAGVALAGAAFEGSHVGVEVEAYRTVNGSLQLVDQYLLEDVKINAYDNDPSARSFQMEAGRVEVDHVARDAKGGLVATSEFGWNFATNSAVNLSDHASFTGDGAVAGGGAITLNYVVRFLDSSGNVLPSGGTNGWIKASDLTLVYDGSDHLITAGAGSLVLDAGKLSPTLSTALQQTTGLRIEVEAWKTTTSGIVTVDDFLFANAYINVEQLGQSNGLAQSQALGFDYTQVQEKHRTLAADGKVVATTTTGWDFTGHTSTSLSDPGDFGGSDVAYTTVGPSLVVGRFVDGKGVAAATEGSNGWIQLGNFNYSTNGSNFPAIGPASPIVAAFELSGSDKLAVALEKLVLAGGATGFQVEALSLIGGQYRLVDEYLFSGVAVDTLAAGANGVTPALVEASAFTHTYYAHDSKGAITGTTTTGFDIPTKTPVTLPNTVDFLPASDTAPSHVETLLSVIRFIGADGKTIIASDNGSGGWVSGAQSFAVAAERGSLQLSLVDDATAVALQSALAKGQKISIDVETYRSSSAGLLLVDDYLYANAQFTGLVLDVNPSAGFDIGQYQHTHNTYDSKNGLSGQSTSGWNFVTDQTTTLTDRGNYATGGVASTALAAAAAQTYYARFVDATGTPIASDGVGGWIKLLGVRSGLSVDSSDGSVSRTLSLDFYTDRADRALLAAYEAGTSGLKLEIDAFTGSGAGARLIDQSLYSNVTLSGMAMASGSVTVDVASVQAQATHYSYDGRGVPTATTFGWDFNTHAATTLTSLGAYNPSTAAGGIGGAVSYYVRLVDENGRTIETDGGARFSLTQGVQFSLVSGVTNYASLQLGSDQSLLALLEAQMQIHPLARLEVEAYANGPGGLRIVDEYLLDHVANLNMNLSGANGTAAILGASFDRFQVTHFTYDGGNVEASTFGWDFALGHAVYLAPPHADVYS